MPCNPQILIQLRSLVQAQQSLEITHLDQHKSFEIWHHQSIEIIKDSSIEVYPAHRSLEVVNDDQPNQPEFQQEESLEIFKLDNKDSQSTSDQKLIVEDIRLDNLNQNLESENTQLEDIKLDDQPIVTQQQTTVAVSDQLEDIKIDLEPTKETEQSEIIPIGDQQQQVEQSEQQQQETSQQQQLEDVKLESEDAGNNQESQQINLTKEEEIHLITNSEEQSNANIEQVNEQKDPYNQNEDVENLQSNVASNTSDQVLQQEDVTFDNQEQTTVNQQEDSKQEVQIEDIKLDNTDISSINVDDIPQQQQAKEIQNDQLSVQSEVKPIEDISIAEDVVVHADEVKIENVKISESNLEDIVTQQQAQEDYTNNTEQQVQEQQVQEDIQENNEIDGQSEDVSVDPDAFSEPQQKVTQINDEDLLKQESDIDEMIRYAQELKEEAKQLKNKKRGEQQLEKMDIMEKAASLEKEVNQLENESEEPQVIEDQISLDVNSAYEDQKEMQVEQPQEEQQPPVIYLNDAGVNPEQQLITQEIKGDEKLMITENQLQEEIDKELQSQEQQVESTSQIEEDDVQIVDASIKLDEDHQDMEVYESGQVDLIPDETQSQVEEVQQIEQPQEQVEVVTPQEDQFQDQDTTKEEGAVEIGLTTDEGEAFIRKPKKSDFLREKQRLKDKLTNVIRDFKLDTVQSNSLDSVVEADKQYSLIIDRLDVPENNEQVIVLKDDDYEQSQIEPEPEQEVKQLGDYLEAVEPDVENVNFIYDDEQQQEQQNIQIEDIKLNDDNTDEETNYKIVEAKDDDLEDAPLESVDDSQQQFLSTDVAVTAEETSASNIENQREDEVISFDEFQKELEVLANTIGNIKQENEESKQSSDYIIVNDNSQVYEATYDEQSNELSQQDEPQVQEDQKQYYQGFEDDQNIEPEIQQSENQEQQQEQQEQQEVEQTFDAPEQEAEDQSFMNEQQEQEDAAQQVERYDDAEPQDQYLTIDNLVKDNSSFGESYEQPPQYYDESDNQSVEQQPENEDGNTLESDYDISEQQSQNQGYQQQQQNDYDQQEQKEQEQDFVVMKAEQFIPQVQDEPQQQEQSSDNQKEDDIYSETPRDENEIDIIVDVGNLQDDQPQLNEQDYDYEDNFETQQPTQNKQPQQQQQTQQQLSSDSISNQKHKQKIQHSITISHNPQQGNTKQSERSIEVQHEDKSLKIEHQVNQDELKKDLKEQLKQELKEELKQEIKQEIQDSHNRRKSPSLVIEENVTKDPERPAQKAINNFNNLLNDVVDDTLKEEGKKHYQKLPIVDVKRDSFNKVEPKIEQGIDDLKKALGLKGGLEVVDNSGKKQVINVDDLKKESEKFLTRPERDNKKDSPQYEEYLKKVTEKTSKNNDQMSNYEEQHNMRKQEILENIKRELEIKKGHITVPSDSPQAELSPYEFERVYLDWEKNKQDIIPSMLQHSIEQPSIQEINSNSEQVSQRSTERMSKKEEVEKEVQELLYGNQKNRKQQSKQSSKEFKVEDLKYIKDDPLLDATYSGFVQVKANLRKRSH
ncbi:unnamed protein product (macronuclear) [Paramecium tetraurelia]|uniref:Uncharacterized protein n=1 Tax=Paramecium tetraurelia TaxID=5888 RepID=A0ECW3_PARTE|nr:uncharacterized protein GSPATT00003999001 [Paramecium tetraurelia]CAK93130.1 unnamed protein product [Paramecium tetraurelia]|eukprot:XP_001460527.1 hypothetical protein (macronuclear) [Paramecium tetraurelia strain d4-2]